MPKGMAQPFKVLVVAAEEHIGEPVRRELEERAPAGQETELRVVVPALADSPFQHAAGDVDEGLARAQRQLETSLAEVSGNGVRAAGQVGDADPIRAIEDALYDFPADEIVVVTHDTDAARWLEDDLYEHAKRRFEPPITHFVVTNGRVEVAGRAGAGVEPSGRRRSSRRATTCPASPWGTSPASSSPSSALSS